MSNEVAALALFAVPLLPLLLALALCVPAGTRAVGPLLPLAAAPAIWLAFAGTAETTVALDWLLLGTVLGLGEHGAVFLGVTGALWLGTGWYAHGYLHDDPRRAQFHFFWLMTMAGNFGLILARDVASFYLFFALMTFAAYGLVIHDRTEPALRAGRVYLVMAVIGEGLILAGLLLARSGLSTPLLPMLADLPGAITTSTHRDLIAACLWLGFGVKAGLPLLHMWLPLAHPVAPIPASAVLSGAMIKAGVLGWMVTLPLGIMSLSMAPTVVAVGFVAAFGAALVGVMQHTPKTVLAYSSISQMGLVTATIGAGLSSPALWPTLAPVVGLFVMHHALAKGTLFLGVGIARHAGGRISPWLLWLALALPGLSLAGVMSSGAVAKLGLKAALYGGDEAPAWWAHLPLLIGLSAIGTTALIARYLWLLRDEEPGAPAPLSVWAGWAVLWLASAFAVIVLPVTAWGGKWPVGAGDFFDLVWPVAAGIALSLAAWRWWRAWPVPAGDVLAWIVALFAYVSPVALSTTTWLSAATDKLARILAAGVARVVDESGRSAFVEHLWRREAALIFAALVLGFILLG